MLNRHGTRLDIGTAEDMAELEFAEAQRARQVQHQQYAQPQQRSGTTRPAGYGGGGGGGSSNLSGASGAAPFLSSPVSYSNPLRHGVGGGGDRSSAAPVVGTAGAPLWPASTLAGSGQDQQQQRYQRGTARNVDEEEVGEAPPVLDITGAGAASNAGHLGAWSTAGYSGTPSYDIGEGESGRRTTHDHNRATAAPSPSSSLDVDGQ